MNFISPFNRSGGAEFVGLRCFLVPSTKHFNPSALIKAGEANVHDGDTSTNRQQPWGNYSSSTIDPTDGQTFWLHGPYAKFTEKGYWSTWVAANSFYEPDLAFQSIQVDPILTRGKVSTAVAETQNIGKAFSGKFELALYYSADRVFSSSDTLLVSFDHYGLNSEGTAKDTLLYLLPSDVPLGMGFLIFVIDQRNLIPEESDSNNFAILPVNLVDPIHCLAEIFEPEDGRFFCTDSINTAIKLTITGGVDSIQIQSECQVNGFRAIPVDGYIQARVPLHQGQNQLEAVCTCIDKEVNSTQCSDTITVYSDTTKPECVFNFDNLPVITGETFDNETGIAEVKVIKAKNCTISIDSFTVCDKVVHFRSDRIDPSKTSCFTLKITNCAGCEGIYDPVALRLDPVLFPSFAFEIPHTDRFLSVTNHGLERIVASVNQHEFELVVAPNQRYIIPLIGERTIDLTEFLLEGDNTVELSCQGPSSSYADVVFSDINSGTVTGLADGPVMAEVIPRTFELFQSYPNPFNPSTTIRFQVPAAWKQPVILSVLNMQGQLIRTLVEGTPLPGTYNVTWEGKDARGNQVSSGIYLCQLKAGEMVIGKKMMLVR